MTEPTHPLPPWLAPVLAFVNTVDVEDHTDTLASGPAALSAWLAGQDLLPDPPPPVTPADYRLALTFRAGLRALALANNGGPVAEAAVAGLRQALGRLPLVVDPGWDQSARPPLRPHRPGPVTAALSQLAAGYATAQAASLWHRLRRCPAEDCADRKSVV